jgi:hypothetical protein
MKGIRDFKKEPIDLSDIFFIFIWFLILSSALDKCYIITFIAYFMYQCFGLGYILGKKKKRS